MLNSYGYPFLCHRPNNYHVSICAEWGCVAPVNDFCLDAMSLEAALALAGDVAMKKLKVVYLARVRSTGLIKKTLRKFEWSALKNEIDVTNAGLSTCS